MAEFDYNKMLLDVQSQRRERKRRRRWIYFAILSLLGVRVNLWLLSYYVEYFDSSVAISDMPPSISVRPLDQMAADNTTAAQYENDGQLRNILPRVACFFMVDQKSVETAVSVRYSNWAKRCSHFVIVSNGVASGGEQSIDGNTILVDINYVIQHELQLRSTESNNENITVSDGNSGYTTFPSPSDERKSYLTLKSFYSWMYMIRQFSDNVDYIMKVDPDSYMLMDNYLSYLSKYYSPNQHAYIGRVFKNNGDHRFPFVTGLSATLSRTTAKLLLSKSSIQNNDKPYQHPDCSAEQFQHGGEADDYALSVCLSSMGVYPAYTRDELGRERFLHFNPSEHVFGSAKPPDWYEMYSFTPHRPRKICCSSDACAFHYVEPERQNGTLIWDTVFGVWHWKVEQNGTI